MNAPTRNSPCPCGSGKKFKHCCGADKPAPPAAVPNLRDLMSAAIARHSAGDQAGAEVLCRQALRVQPDNPDCVHLLGVICFKTDRLREAVALMLHACTLTAWQAERMHLNLVRALSALYRDSNRDAIGLKQIAYRIWQGKRARQLRDVAPLVSIVLPSYNHAGFIHECLESVYRQTWPHIELIVIDDGSRDASVPIIRESLKDCPFPHQFVARENRGAHATINEAIGLARGAYINILNSDDRFAPERIARMVDGVARSGADWGFAGVEIIDAAGQAAEQAPGSMAEYLAGTLRNTASAPTAGFALLRHNVAISTGNLFIDKQFFHRIGEFSELRYNHDWDFVLRATLVSEPVYVPQPLYHYRVHGNNTILESGSAPQLEADRMLLAHVQHLLTSTSEPNPFAPTQSNWGKAIQLYMVCHGLGQFLPIAQIHELAQFATSQAGQEFAAPPSLAPLDQLPELTASLPLLASLRPPDEAGTATFDQYQRYGMAARAIDSVRKEGQVFSILEVGANTHKLLGKLLPLDRITYLDREIPAEMPGASDILIGDATRLDMADRCFDIVVALDVFEHIEPAQRAAFLQHTSRVADCLTLIAAPFENEAVQRAEREAQAYWNRLFPYPYRWLAEHAENGLPKLKQTTDLLREMGVGHCGFGHGGLDLWRELLNAHFAAEICPDLRGPIAALDRYYGEYLFAHDIDAEAGYRQFLFCSRSPDVLAQLQAFCARTVNAGPMPDLSPIFEVLTAMQQMGLGHASLQRIRS